MEWYVPIQPCKMPGGNTPQRPRAGEDSLILRGKVPDGRPRFLIAYQNGNIQLMCNENISSVVFVQNHKIS